jgi:hypothetical protein
VALLLADLSPDLINLDPATGELAHLLIHELRAAAAYFDEKAADRIAVRPGHPLGAADRISLDQAIDDSDTTGKRYAVHVSSPKRNQRITPYFSNV